MKFRRTFRFHGLKKPRVRQTWNKYNLYNLAQTGSVDRAYVFKNGTFFQQKWAAKRLARGYHGEHIKERAWERMFDRRLLSVVDMDPEYMAKYDGSEQAAGRGSGKELPQVKQHDILEKQAGNRFKTPYMQMAFAPMERRLDIAVFRALFASSARQARQFCVHGAVKVNGKKMKYPGYLLNPGDMFQVDPERVLFATGAKKDPDTVQDALKPAESEESAEATEEAEPEPEAQAETTPEVEPTPVDEAAAAKSQAAELRSLRDRVKDFLKTSFGDLSVKQKQSLRALSKDIKAAASRAGKGHSEDVEGLTTLFSQLGVGPSKSDDKQIDHDPDAKDEDGLTKLERERLSELLAEEAENPWDPSKPYATPWRPRPFMAPFMFIPRYLEVNQKICSAVYLRHPVARAGRSEIPTPWGKDIMQLSHNWYLRRH